MKRGWIDEILSLSNNWIISIRLCIVVLPVLFTSFLLYLGNYDCVSSIRVSIHLSLASIFVKTESGPPRV